MSSNSLMPVYDMSVAVDSLHGIRALPRVLPG